jgi:hypothetical protein
VTERPGRRDLGGETWAESELRLAAAAVNEDLVAGDEAGVIGGEEGDGLGEPFGAGYASQTA